MTVDGELRCSDATACVTRLCILIFTGMLKAAQMTANCPEQPETVLITIF